MCEVIPGTAQISFSDIEVLERNNRAPHGHIGEDDIECYDRSDDDQVLALRREIAAGALGEGAPDG